MANDRLYLKCRKCPEMITLYKYYPNGGYCPSEGILGDFIDTHVRGCFTFGFDLNSERCFDIIPENGTPMTYTDKGPRLT